MARLNQIEVRESDVTRSKEHSWKLRSTGHHVCELLLHHLGCDFVLDGSSKFSAILGQRPEHDEPFRTVLGVTWYYVEDFDIHHHISCPAEEQQESILVELVNVMSTAARSAGADPTAIHVAAAEIRKADFCCDIPIKKLGRSTPDRKLRIEVYRRLGLDVGETWEARISSRDGTIFGSEPMVDSPGLLNRTDQFAKSKWTGKCFQITNRQGHVEYTLDVSPYIERSSSGRSDCA